MMKLPDHAMTVKEVAAFVAVSVRTVRRWISTGELPVVRPCPRMVRVYPTQLKRFLDAKEGR